MIITSSTLGMDASTVYTEVNTKYGVQAIINGSPQSRDRFQFNPTISDAGSSRTVASKEQNSALSVSRVTGVGNTLSHNYSEEQFVGKIVSQVLDQQVEITEFRDESEAGQVLPNNGDQHVRHRISSSGMEVTLGLDLFEYRQEKLEVRTSGTLRTADGREINLKLDLLLEREEVVRQSGLRILSSRFIDPLVLSFNDGLSVLDNSTFRFDLNCDGKKEEISSLKSGSGFLVLDKNRDGVVNNGLELFGPESGYGYDELSIYDVDGNNWIDENDPVFEQLQLWMAGGSDSGKLVSLEEAGVGALSLASAEAHFNLKDSSGRVIGQIAQSGIFVTENGGVRPLSEVKLGTVEEDQSTITFGLSTQLRMAILELQEMLAKHRRRVANIAAMQHREEKIEKQQDWLLQRLFKLQDDKSNYLG